MTDDCKKVIIDEISATGEGITPVVALRPGGGKSTFIVEQMANAIQTKSGLMVVTDSVKRLNDAKEDTLDYIGKYVKRNSNKIAVLTKDNYYSEVNDAKNKNIICITTQRFFQMKPSEINILVSSNKKGINRIYIDEVPMILETFDIDISMLSKMDAAINTSISNLEDQEKKQKFIDAFQLVNEHIRRAFRDVEQKQNIEGEVEVDSAGFFYLVHDGYQLSVPWYDAELADAGAVLVDMMQEFRRELMSYNFQMPTIMECLIDAVVNGAEIISRKQKPTDEGFRYRNFLTVIKDYRRWFTEVSAQIVVMDGTGAINPKYDDPVFHIVDCSKYERNIPELTINLINTNGSKTTLTGDKEYTQSIVDYVRSMPDKPESIFTYKDIEEVFKDCADVVAHFGNIKGDNKYRTMKHIVEVGIPTLSYEIYETLYARIYQNKHINEPMTYFERVKDNNLTAQLLSLYKDDLLMDDCKIIVRRQKVIQPDQVAWQIVPIQRLYDFRNRMVLTDIIQNVFRSAIRNEDNKDSVVYDIIYGYSFHETNNQRMNHIMQMNKELADMIEAHFIQLGATVNRLGVPDEVLKQKALSREKFSKRNDNIGAMISWLECQFGERIVSISELSTESGVAKNLVNITIKQNKYLKKHIIHVGYNQWMVRV